MRFCGAGVPHQQPPELLSHSGHFTSYIHNRVSLFPEFV